MAPTEVQQHDHGNQTGDCFEVAAGLAVSRYLEDMAAEARIPLVLGPKSPWRVVHGLPVGTAGPVKDRRYWHGWVELCGTGGTVHCIDFSNGNKLAVPRPVFYRIGSLDEAHVWRFTPTEARAAFRREGHCGPWVPGWESMADGDRPASDPYYVPAP